MRGRRITALATVTLLALTAAACGGDEALAPQVPGEPAEVSVPLSEQAPADAAAASAEAAGDETSTSPDDATTDTDASGDTGAAVTETPIPQADGGADQGGGTAAPDDAADGPANDTPPPDGSNAEQFEDFCAQNPGAC